MSALSYIPFSYTIGEYAFGVAEIGVAITMLYYLSINIGFAVIMS
jgi:hypothetical protein